LLELHAVSTGRQSLEEWLNISLKIHKSVNYLHIREKSWTFNQKLDAVEQLVKAGVPPNQIIINNEPKILEKFPLGGVQFPERANIQVYHRRDWRLGSSVHDDAVAKEKEAAGADYLFYGHVYETRSKPGLPARGISHLKNVAESVSCPVIAIGGITPERVPSCIAAGASGVAVLSGIYEADDPAGRAEAYRLALKKEEKHEEKL